MLDNAITSFCNEQYYYHWFLKKILHLEYHIIILQESRSTSALLITEEVRNQAEIYR